MDGRHTDDIDGVVGGGEPPDSDDPVAIKRALSACLARQKELQEELNRERACCEKEKARVKEVINRLFPRFVRDDVFMGRPVNVRYYNDVTVLFADIENFSVRSSAYTPVELVERLDSYFSQFDDVSEIYGLEKIKTIGDCYMCAGGLPEQDTRNPYRVVMAGLVIQQLVARMTESLVSLGRVPFEFRLGIHTGQAVAGVVGKWKPAYDIWGRAANIGSLMVQAGEVKKVNISRSTYELVSDAFQCVFRGSIPTKGGTAMRMYFVERLKPTFSDDNEGLVPNPRFMKRAAISV